MMLAIATELDYGIHTMDVQMAFLNVGMEEEKVTSIMNQRGDMEYVIKHFDMKGCHPAYKPGEGPNLSLSQLKVNLLDKEDKKRYQSITGDNIYLGLLFPYGALFAVNQLAMTLSKPSKAHIAAAKNLLRYLVGCVNFITYKRGRFKLLAYSDAN